MKTETSHTKSLLIGGSTLTAAVLASSSAHAALDVQDLNYTVPDNTTVYFDLGVDPVVFSSTNGGQGFSAEGPEIETGVVVAYKDQGSFITGATDDPFTPPLQPGDTVDGSSDFSNDADFGGGSNAGSFFGSPTNPGTYYYGFEIEDQQSVEHYGYIVLSQSGGINETTGGNNITDTINQVVFDDMDTLGVMVEAVPEPNTSSLLAAAAMGAAGLALYRRTRRKSA